MTERTERTERVEKRINVDQVVNYLSHSFAKAASRAAPKIGNRAIRTVSNGNVYTTPLYRYQVDFTYLVNDIQRGPTYIVPKLIQDANDLIARLEKEEGEKGE
jgi:hypothetical protein